MVAIKLTGFQGEQPHIIPRLLPEFAAQIALDTRMDDGGLTPIHKAKLIDTADGVDHQTIFKFGSAWLSWSGVVHAAPGPVDDTRLYYTGDGVPKMRKDSTDYDLAIDPPGTALTATLGGSGSGDVVTRVYVYTWVTDFGEESEPAAASNAIDWQPGNTVTLSGFEATPSGRNITKQRIYRSQTGQSGTYFYLIAERAAATTDFDDTIAVDAFQEPLPSADWNAPPDDLEGLTAMANGMMAAFAGRKVYFCEPYRPHAWPEKYVLTTDWDVVALGAIGSTLIIMTEGQPYIAVGTLPEAMQPKKLEANYPCINARGVADLGFAICYPSNEGLVAVFANGQVDLVSRNLFDRDDWLGYSPSTLIGSHHQGFYIGFYDTVDAHGAALIGSLAISVGNQPFLIRSTTPAKSAVHNTPDGGLYYLKEGTDEIWRFDHPETAPAVLYWKSKEFILPYPENFGAIQIDGATVFDPAEVAAAETERGATEAANDALIASGDVESEINGAPLNAYAFGGSALGSLCSCDGSTTVGVYADGNRVATVTAVNRAVRLPSGFKARKWEIDVAGDLEVTQIVMGKTMSDIKGVA